MNVQSQWSCKQQRPHFDIAQGHPHKPVLVQGIKDEYLSPAVKGKQKSMWDKKQKHVYHGAHGVLRTWKFVSLASCLNWLTALHTAQFVDLLPVLCGSLEFICSAVKHNPSSTVQKYSGNMHRSHSLWPRCSRTQDRLQSHPFQSSIGKYRPYTIRESSLAQTIWSQWSWWQWLSWTCTCTQFLMCSIFSLCTVLHYVCEVAHTSKSELGRVNPFQCWAELTLLRRLTLQFVYTFHCESCLYLLCVRLHLFTALQSVTKFIPWKSCPPFECPALSILPMKETQHS